MDTGLSRIFQIAENQLNERTNFDLPSSKSSHVLFTDASKYAWACVLTQEETYMTEGKEVKNLHPITYVSGLFRGRLNNWACLTKEAYAIYMSIKKLM